MFLVKESLYSKKKLSKTREIIAKTGSIALKNMIQPYENKRYVFLVDIIINKG
jgi:hypothetical protein